MLLTEWNWENARAVWLEESWKEAWEKGWKEGREEGREEQNTELLEMIEAGRGIEEIKKRLETERDAGFADVRCGAKRRRQ